MRAEDRIILAVGFLGLAVIIGYQERKLDKLETTTEEIRQDIKAIKREVMEPPMSVSDKDRRCLELNIFQEAGTEPREGKLAVGHVTINRLHTLRWGNSICDVVYSRAQFSWTLYRHKREEVPRGPLWEESKLVAHEVLKGERIPTLTGATYYHANYVNPAWRHQKVKVDQIGRHIFYRKPQT